MGDVHIGTLAEAAEAEFMYTYESKASPLTRATLGIGTLRIGGGVALSMRHDVTGYWSKALGFGLTEPISSDLIDQVIRFYVAEGSSGAVIQIAPNARPADWAEILARHDLRPESHWIKLACKVDDVVADRGTGLRIGPVGANDRRRWASTTLRAFGMPEYGLVDMMAESLAHPNFRPFAAWDGDEMVATANLFIHGKLGSLSSTATVPSHRNRGAQSALITARAREAANAGCVWLCAETGAPEDGGTTSFGNLQRSGMRILYERQNWVWSPPADSGRPSP